MVANAILVDSVENSTAINNDRIASWLRRGKLFNFVRTARKGYNFFHCDAIGFVEPTIKGLNSGFLRKVGVACAEKRSFVWTS